MFLTYVRSMNIDDRPATDLTLWKISTGHNYAAGHPNHVMFCSRVGCG